LDLLKLTKKSVSPLIQQGSNAAQAGMVKFKKAISQTPPDAQEIEKFLDSKGISFKSTALLKKWGVMPHTKLSASALFLDADGNAEHWDDRLRRFIPKDAERKAFIAPFVEKDIGLWLPLVR